jgi:hypothetical protein
MGDPMATENDDLNRVQAQLGDVLAQLRAKLAAATTAEQIRAIYGEIAEVNHRVTMVGQLIFHQQTAGISAAAKEVAAAKARVDVAIADIDNLNNALQAISGFLGVVDKVIDTAKLVGL